MSVFTQMFPLRDDDDEPPEEPRSPRWFGPPDDELGVVLPEAVVLAHSGRGVVALSHAVAYSTGVSFEFVARARRLSQAEANRVFHEQHMFEEKDLPDALLRIGLELADGSRVSNLGGWRAQGRLMDPDTEPVDPVLLPHAGGGGSSTGGQVTMRPGYWLWPLPPPGPLRISCEWPLVDIELTTVEIDGTALADAARQPRSLWP
jgi:hypothetical protein